MELPDELSVPEMALFLKVNEETVRRNIRSKRLPAIRRGTQWFVAREDALLFANAYDKRTGQIRRMV